MKAIKSRVDTMFPNNSNVMTHTFNFRVPLRKKLEETRNIHCVYKMMKKYLSEKEKQQRERAAVTQLAMRLRTQDLELRNARNTLKEVNGSPRNIPTVTWFHQCYLEWHLDWVNTFVLCKDSNVICYIGFVNLHQQTTCHNPIAAET